MTTTTTSRPARSTTNGGSARKDFSALIQTKGNGLPNRYVLHGREGWGKTSFAAMMPNPLFLQTRGETGLETLINAGQLPEVPHLPEIMSWQELLDVLQWVRESEHSYKTLAIDALNGAERLCHEHVCHRDFSDDWTDKGFMGYMRGFEVSLADWRLFLGLLDSIRIERRMTIMLLCHTKVTTFKNPEGADFDRYQPDMSPKTWSLTHKWADVVMFGNFETIVGSVNENKKTGAQKGKGISQTRLLLTENHAAYDAKNRLGLAPEIEMGNSPAEAWKAFKDAVIAGRQNTAAVSSEEGAA